VNRIESWTEKIVRLALARAGNSATSRAVELIEMGEPESHPEVIAQMAIGNALRDAAASIHQALETGLLPDPYPEVNHVLAAEDPARTD